MVLRSEVIVQLNELESSIENWKDPKYELRITLHSVFQGSEKDNEAIRKDIHIITNAIKKLWREQKNREFSERESKKDGPIKTVTEEEEQD